MRKAGFTLIELLIVVAIIAILAAIAVPNFLEAQVRSKVSRVKADIRSLATAIESYYVDNNSYPSCDSSCDAPGSVTSVQPQPGYGVNNPRGATAQLLSMPAFRRKQNDEDLLSTLTTPISYITSYFIDPFAKTKGAVYMYSTPGFVTGAISLEVQNSGWMTWSFGPDADEALNASLPPGDIACTNVFPAAGPDPRVEETWYNPAAKVPSDLLIQYGTYDPTNGSTSNGDVYRQKQ